VFIAKYADVILAVAVVGGAIDKLFADVVVVSFWVVKRDYINILIHSSLTFQDV